MSYDDSACVKMLSTLLLLTINRHRSGQGLHKARYIGLQTEISGSGLLNDSNRHSSHPLCNVALGLYWICSSLSNAKSIDL